MLAPLLIATMRLSCQRSRATYFLIPATASAPAGSTIERVSSNTSWMAAQISSVSTSRISSTCALHSANVSSPTRLTATPSAKIPTRSRVTRRPACSDSYMPADSSGSTPMIRTFGYRYFTYTAIPAIRPPPPIGTKIASTLPAGLPQDLHADRALAGDDVGIVERMHEDEVTLARQHQGALERAVVVIPMQHDLRAEVPDGLHFDLRAPSAA